ncbi:ABC transporter substrate-binding protein [Bacillus sp. J14TS2]|uniref:ABC transporter substrate-binding protein n=1 Tax=Bacillus sp. J14TS2 TaxID=2807188 RepID=UPI001B2D96BB|nr:ABC transporter substrate-binding protein [Bacillus sp. J14TS2]GIN71875.1 ABC transporter substrate-binding protein [Bacillus sp. J14TS2]
MKCYQDGRKNGLFLGLFLIITLLCITGCASGEKVVQSESNKAAESNEKSNSAFPRTLSIEGKEVTVQAQPQQIAALSLNVAEIVIDLVGTDSLVAITESAENASLSHYSQEIEKIPYKVKGATSLDPEVVLSYDPDLVLLTLTHGAEQDAEKLLEQSGTPLASFSRWTTVQDVMENYLAIGQLLGEEEKSEEIVDQLEQKITQAQSLVKVSDQQPTVLILSQVGSNTGPYILGPSSIAYDLIQLAGGTPGSDVLGLEKSAPASIEHLIDMDPDYIILVEWGTTSDEFQDLVDSEGFQTLTAVQEDKIKRMKAKDISQANRYIVDQLVPLVEWLHPNETGKE